MTGSAPANARQDGEGNPQIAFHACKVRIRGYSAEWYRMYRKNGPCGPKVRLEGPPVGGSLSLDSLRRRPVYSTRDGLRCIAEARPGPAYAAELTDEIHEWTFDWAEHGSLCVGRLYVFVRTSRSHPAVGYGFAGMAPNCLSTVAESQ